MPPPWGRVGNPLFRCMKNAYSADFAMMPYARRTGQEAQFKQSRSKVSQMRCRGCRRGGNWAACRLVRGGLFIL